MWGTMPFCSSVRIDLTDMPLCRESSLMSINASMLGRILRDTQGVATETT